MSSKKRVAIYFENRLGRNDGSPLYMLNLLKEMKDIEVVHLIPDGNYDLFGKFDLHLWIDWGEDGLTDILPYKVTLPEHDKEHPLVYVASDTHLGYDYRLKMAKEADYVFVNQKPAQEQFKKAGVEAIWMPHAVEPRAFPNAPQALKKYDVCFVGHLVSEERIQVLDAIFKAFPNFWFGSKLSRYVMNNGQQDDCADIFRKSKIVLNPPTKDDVNMRVFEALATQSFLLTKRVPGLKELFVDGKELVMYNDVDDAIEKAKYYLEHDSEREGIAKLGYEKVMKKHTYQHRLDKIFEVIGFL